MTPPSCHSWYIFFVAYNKLLGKDGTQHEVCEYRSFLKQSTGSINVPWLENLVMFSLNIRAVFTV